MQYSSTNWLHVVARPLLVEQKAYICMYFVKVEHVIYSVDAGQQSLGSLGSIQVTNLCNIVSFSLFIISIKSIFSLNVCTFIRWNKSTSFVRFLCTCSLNEDRTFLKYKKKYIYIHIYRYTYIQISLLHFDWNECELQTTDLCNVRRIDPNEGPTDRLANSIGKLTTTIGYGNAAATMYSNTKCSSPSSAICTLKGNQQL